MKSTHLITGILLLSSFSLFAQIPTIQDCLGAIPVCQEVYVEALSPSGDGNYNSEINTSISCTAGELNSIWYTFTVDQAGDFGFVIDPNDPDDDYDWCLFDITNASCEDISSNIDLIVSCNASGGIGCHGETGANGASTFDIQGAGCGFFPPDINFGDSKYNALIPVTAGNTYVLMVSNWSGSPNGYTLDFGLSQVSIFDNLAPTIAQAEVPDDCNETEVVLTFSEFIQCSTIDADDFEVIGPSGPLGFTLAATGCDAGGDFEKVFTLTLDDPIFELGNYVVNLLVDGATEALDLCDNPALPYSFPFTINEALALSLDLGPDIVLCPGETLELDATNPIAVYTWQDGSSDSTFTVNSPGLYTVEVTNSCGTLTDEIQVDYTVFPAIDFGLDTFLCEGESITLDATFPASTYVWQDGSDDPVFNVVTEGIYSVEITNVCGIASDEIFVDFIPPILLDLPTNPALCFGDTLELDATNEAATYVWSTGWVGPIIDIWETGSYEVAVSTVCETQIATIDLVVKEEQVFELGPDTLLCSDDTLVLGAELIGATYLWQDNSEEPFFTVTEPGTYTVTINDPCAIIEDFINIEYIPAIDYDLGEDKYLCENQVFLDATTNGVANYLWNDGTILPFFVAQEPGVYSVNVYNQCEEIKDQIELFECEQCDIYFPNIFSPDFDGFNDFFYPQSDCPLEGFTMRVFDRWGALLYQTTNPQQGWDGSLNGQPLPNGTYTWFMEFSVTENLIKRPVLANGAVTILR